MSFGREEDYQGVMLKSYVLLLRLLRNHTLVWLRGDCYILLEDIHLKNLQRILVPGVKWVEESL